MSYYFNDLMSYFPKLFDEMMPHTGLIMLVFVSKNCKIGRVSSLVWYSRIAYKKSQIPDCRSVHGCKTALLQKKRGSPTTQKGLKVMLRAALVCGPIYLLLWARHRQTCYVISWIVLCTTVKSQNSLLLRWEEHVIIAHLMLLHWKHSLFQCCFWFTVNPLS